MLSGDLRIVSSIYIDYKYIIIYIYMVVGIMFYLGQLMQKNAILVELKFFYL